MRKTPQTRVLVVEADPKKGEWYAEAIRDSLDSEVVIDTLSSRDPSLDWMGRGNYQMVVIDSGPAPFEPQLASLEQIRRLKPNTSVILVRDKATVEQAVLGMRQGAEDFLVQPLDRDKFKAAVRRGVERSRMIGGDEQASHFFSLVQTCQFISAARDLGQVLSAVQGYLARELRSDQSTVYLVDPQMAEGSAGFQRWNPQAEPDSSWVDIALAESGAFAQVADQPQGYTLIPKGRMSPAIFVFWFPTGDSRTAACVCVSPKVSASEERVESALRLLSSQIEVATRNIAQYAGVEKLAFTDDATGLYNTRYLYQILDHELARAERDSKPFAVLFLDCDFFKKVNDTHGHRVGTRLLHDLGELLKGLVRKKDTVFRYGGDEFVAVLSECDEKTARWVAERIRSSVEAHSFLEDEKLSISVTVSIGIALYPTHAKTRKEIIDAADRAMYSAKARSRNFVSLAELVHE